MNIPDGTAGSWIKPAVQSVLHVTLQRAPARYHQISRRENKVFQTPTEIHWRIPTYRTREFTKVELLFFSFPYFHLISLCFTRLCYLVYLSFVYSFVFFFIFSFSPVCMLNASTLFSFLLFIYFSFVLYIVLFCFFHSLFTSTLPSCSYPFRISFLFFPSSLIFYIFFLSLI
jgi:hypothetical protein